MNKLRKFTPGIDFMVILLLTFAIVFQVGQKVEAYTFSWVDLMENIFILIIWTLSSIGLYRHFKGLDNDLL